MSLLGDMVAAGRQPNLNTYRVLINAAVRADQAGLAFQIFQVRAARRTRRGGQAGTGQPGTAAAGCDFGRHGPEAGSWEAW